MTRRFDLTAGQWAVLEPLLPKGKKPGRPPKWGKRQLIDGIRWRVRTGAPWRAGVAATLELFLVPGTVRNYLATMMTKIGARNRIDAVRIARERGWSVEGQAG